MNDTITKNKTSTKDQQILHDAINVGIEKDKTAAIMALNAIIEKWKSRDADYISTYTDLYSTLQRFDKVIAGRYDEVNAPQYVSLVAQLLAIGHINESNLEGLSEGVLDRILLYKQLRDKQ